MLIAAEVKGEILKFIEQRIETDAMWAEAFSKLIALDEADQQGAVWDLLEAVKDSMRWDESFTKHPEVLDLIMERGRKSMEKREKEKGERGAGKSVKD